MKAFALADGPAIYAQGLPATKNVQPLHYAAQSEPFTVTDKNGAIQQGNAGDYVGYDPITGNVFMLRKAYFDANFTFVGQPVT
jgi:hypothetical protein